jgi:sugar phosphate isomerase/epimerase
MWAQQERFIDIEAFRTTAAEMGYTAIEVSHSTDTPRLEQLLKPGPIPLSSLHAPTPRLKLKDGRWNGDANLGDPDEEARRVAVEHHLRTIDYAWSASLKFVVVHLGGVGAVMTSHERELRRLYDSGVREGEEVEMLRAQCRAHRQEGLDAHLEPARRSLRELTEYASRFEIALGLENRYHYHEFPGPDEAEYLLADYTNEVAGYWHDTGHAEVQHRIGLIDRRRLVVHRRRVAGYGAACLRDRPASAGPARRACAGISEGAWRD